MSYNPTDYIEYLKIQVKSNDSRIKSSAAALAKMAESGDTYGVMDKSQQIQRISAETLSKSRIVRILERTSDSAEKTLEDLIGSVDHEFTRPQDVKEAMKYVIDRMDH